MRKAARYRTSPFWVEGLAYRRSARDGPASKPGVTRHRDLPWLRGLDPLSRQVPRAREDLREVAVQPRQRGRLPAASSAERRHQRLERGRAVARPVLRSREHRDVRRGGREQRDLEAGRAADGQRHASSACSGRVRRAPGPPGGRRSRRRPPAASAAASYPASRSCRSRTGLRCSLFSACSRSIAAGSSSGATDTWRMQPATASRKVRSDLQRAPAAHELDADAAAQALGRQHGDHADGAGARHVRAAARRQVVAFDVDDAERAAAPRLLAQRQRCRLGVGHEPDADRAVLPDDAVGFGLRRGNRPGGQFDRRGRAWRRRRPGESRRCGRG